MTLKKFTLTFLLNTVINPEYIKVNYEPYLKKELQVVSLSEHLHHGRNE